VIGDDILGQSSGGATSWLLYDGHGSTRALAGADAQGQPLITARYSYDVYGMMLGGDPSISRPAATDLLYSGEQFDPGLQQQYLRARYYDQAAGVFASLDPYEGDTGEPQSLHRYAYCQGDGVNGIDPSGLFGVMEVLCTIFAGNIVLAQAAAPANVNAKKVRIAILVGGWMHKNEMVNTYRWTPQESAAESVNERRNFLAIKGQLEKADLEHRAALRDAALIANVDLTVTVDWLTPDSLAAALRDADIVGVMAHGASQNGKLLLGYYPNAAERDGQGDLRTLDASASIAAAQGGVRGKISKAVVLDACFAHVVYPSKQEPGGVLTQNNVFVAGMYGDKSHAFWDDRYVLHIPAVPEWIRKISKLIRFVKEAK